MTDTNPPITQDIVIGELLASYPEALGVIQKHFGSGCFTCPGMKMESIGFGAMMHGLDPVLIVSEINAAVAARKGA
jgi:hybrid cluster-associated redox disulfide protein